MPIFQIFSVFKNCALTVYIIFSVLSHLHIPRLRRAPGTNKSLNLSKFLNGYICCECTIFNKTGTPEQGQQTSLCRMPKSKSFHLLDHMVSPATAQLYHSMRKAASVNISARGKLQIAHGLGSAFPCTNEAHQTSL